MRGEVTTTMYRRPNCLPSPAPFLRPLFLAAGLFFLAACSTAEQDQAQACGTEDRTLNLGFYGALRSRQLQ